MGRAARHQHGTVVMYADALTGSMRRAIDEVTRRRNIQLEYNAKFDIKPHSIIKPIREKLILREEKSEKTPSIIQLSKKESVDITKIDRSSLTPLDKKKLVLGLKRAMNKASHELDFELAATLRDLIADLEP